MCGKIMTVLLIFVVLNCSMARYNGRLHCIVGVLPTCYKRKAATYFYPPGGTGREHLWNHVNMFETGVVRANECSSARSGGIIGIYFRFSLR